LEEGKYRSAAEIAAAEGVTRSFVNRLLRLTLLAPGTFETILDGRQSKSLELAVVTGKLPSAWEEQRATSPKDLCPFGLNAYVDEHRVAGAKASRSRAMKAKAGAQPGDRLDGLPIAVSSISFSSCCSLVAG
jgi:hypothetical protein